MSTPKLEVSNDGEAFIIISPYWNDYDPKIKAEWLGCWIYALQRMYDAALVEAETDEAIKKAQRK